MTEQDMKREVQVFARAYPTGNTLRLLSLCSTGVISWEDGYKLAVKAMNKANDVVAAEFPDRVGADDTMRDDVR